MCGMFGCLLREGKAAPLIHEALKRIEYRGHDSVGVAAVGGGGLQVKKDRGLVSQVHRRWNLDLLEGGTGIGHIRWATHGAPLRVNAHPHTDCDEKIAVVHDGVIENFRELAETLIADGHTFRSKTDTEVIPHLIENYQQQGLPYLKSVSEALKRLEGSYAIALLHRDHPGKVVFARMHRSLLAATNKSGSYVSSDIATILPLSEKVLDVEEGELGVLTEGGVKLLRVSDLSPVNRVFRGVDWSQEMAQKHGHPHFSLREIHEQPQSMEDTLRLQKRYVDLITTFLDRSEEIYLLACGASYNSCLAASYLFSSLCNLSTYPIIASEFIEQCGDSVNIDSTILAISQSGETADVLHAIEHARFRAATILGLTNTLDSTLTRISRAYICQQSGPEIGDAVYKTFTSQLLVLTQLAISLAKVRGKMSQGRIDELEEKLSEIPSLVGRVIESQEAKIQEVVKKYERAPCIYYLGRGINTATAQEGGLKLMEVAYKPSIAYPAGESKHGPISLVEKRFPIIFLCPRGRMRSALIGNIMEMKARGGNIIAVLDEEDDEIKGLVDDYFEAPTGIPEVLSPIPYIVPLQLFAYYMAVESGLDPDKAKNLSKPGAKSG